MNEGRGYACEFVAWQFLTNLSEREAIDFLLYELKSTSPSASAGHGAQDTPAAHQNGNTHNQDNEETPLLGSSQHGRIPSYFGTDSVLSNTAAGVPYSDEFAARYENLSALEIAAVSGSKKFISQRPVQKIINGLWRVRTSRLSPIKPSHSIRATLFSGRRSALIPLNALNSTTAGELTHSVGCVFLGI